MALLACLFATSASAEPLGRLFHTQQERDALDAVRRATPAGSTATTTEPERDGVTVSGVVTRSDGKRSTWINGHMEHDAPAAGSVSVPVRGPSGEVKLKVGQSIDPATGKITEGYRDPLSPKLPTNPEEKPPLPAAPPKKPAAPHHDDSDTDPTN